MEQPVELDAGTMADPRLKNMADPRLKNKHAIFLVISMVDTPEHSHTPSPFPRLCLTHGKALTT